jgi:RNA polymerase sigma-70 factor, ECF subfamily
MSEALSFRLPPETNWDEIEGMVTLGLIWAMTPRTSVGMMRPNEAKTHRPIFVKLTASGLSAGMMLSTSHGRHPATRLLRPAPSGTSSQCTQRAKEETCGSKQGIQSKGFCQLRMARQGLQPGFGLADKTLDGSPPLTGSRREKCHGTNADRVSLPLRQCCRFSAWSVAAARNLAEYPTDQNLRCVKTMKDASLFGCVDGLFGYAMALTRNPTEAADLVQETYVRALKAKERLRHGSNVKSWMFTILRNIWLNQLRHKHRAPQIVELEAHQGTADTTTKRSKDPYAQYVSEMEQKEVRNAIQQLPTQFREIIILREYEELSYQEIAALLECPAGTVMSRLARARSRLRVLLSENEQSPQQNKGRKFKGCSPEV